MRPRQLAARAVASTTIVLAGLGAVGPTPAASADPTAGASPGPPTVTGWIDRHASPLATTDPTDPVGDLRPLDRVVRGAPVVGLGESTHGSREQFRVKHRMVRYLVEHRGFRTVAFEEDFAGGVLVDRYVTTGEGDPRRLVQDMASPLWGTEEILDLVEWMRSYNERHREPVRFLGTDVLRLRPLSFDALRDHVGRVAPDRLADLEGYLVPLAVRGDPRDPSDQIGWYRERSEAEQQQLIDTAARLATFVAELPAGDDRLRREHAVQHARAIHGWYEYYEELGGFRGTREHDIADTITWWRRLTGHRVAYWAANAHVTSAPELTFRDPSPQHGTMAGGLLERRLGRGYVAVGTLFHDGAITSGYQDPGPEPIGPPGPTLIEATLGAAASPAYVLPVPDRAPGPVGEWVAGEATSRMILPAYREGDDPDAYTMTVPALRDAFDAVVFVEHTTASRIVGGQRAAG